MVVTFCSYSSVSITTVAFPLSVGRIIIIFFSSASACLSFLLMFGLGSFAVFIIPIIRDLSCSDLVFGLFRSDDEFLDRQLVWCNREV